MTATRSVIWFQVRSSQSSLVRCLELEKRCESGAREIDALRRGLVDMQAALQHERKRAKKLQSENDRLKVRRGPTRL